MLLLQVVALVTLHCSLESPCETSQVLSHVFSRSGYSGEDLCEGSRSKAEVSPWDTKPDRHVSWLKLLFKTARSHYGPWLRIEDVSLRRRSVPFRQLLFEYVHRDAVRDRVRF